MSSPRSFVNHYDILGLKKDALDKDISAAYKRLALKHHPDKTGNDSDSMAQFQKARLFMTLKYPIDYNPKIQEAVDTLRDPQRRREFDKRLEAQTASRRLGTENVSDFDFASPRKGGKRSAARYMPNPPNVTHGERTRQSSSGSRQQDEAPGWKFKSASQEKRYLWTHGRSVHMDPSSQESMDEIARNVDVLEQWEREYAGHDDEVERAKEAIRREECGDEHPWITEVTEETSRAQLEENSSE